jgi:DUF4097 and DUF4098 domain-containing protein YvlB
VWFCSLAVILLEASCNDVEHWGPRVRRERNVESSAPMPAGSTLRIDLKNGPISVRGADANECRLSAKIEVHAASKEKAKEFADAVQVSLQPAGDGLEVVTKAPPTAGLGDFSVTLTLSVPRRTALKLVTGEGDVRISNIQGAIEAVTSEGNLQIDGVKGDLLAKNHEGDVTCSKIEGGSIDLYAARGDIRLEESKATSCKIENADGRVYVAETRAQSMFLRTTSGGIRCQNVSARKLDCTSSAGAAYITWAPDAPRSPDITVTLTDGSITFEGIADISAVLEAFSNSESINAKIPGVSREPGKTLQVTLRDGGGRLIFRTHEGSITIR